MESKPALRSKLYTFLREHQHTILHSTATGEIYDAFKNIQLLIENSSESSVILRNYFPASDIPVMCVEFTENYLDAYLDELLTNLSVVWAKHALNGKNNQVFENIFMNDVISTSTLSSLCRNVSDARFNKYFKFIKG